MLILLDLALTRTMTMISDTWTATVFAHLSGVAEAVPAGQLVVKEEGARVLSSTFGYGNLAFIKPTAYQNLLVTLADLVNRIFRNLDHQIRVCQNDLT
jgi:hypothetical protein